MTCRMCRFRPVHRSWRTLAVIVRACRARQLCLDCYARRALDEGYALANATFAAASAAKHRR